jgi:hypothetical protein
LKERLPIALEWLVLNGKALHETYSQIKDIGSSFCNGDLDNEETETEDGKNEGKEAEEDEEDEGEDEDEDEDEDEEGSDFMSDM